MLTLHIASEFAHEFTIHPEPADNLSYNKWHAKYRNTQVGDREVHQEHVLSSAHVRVLNHHKNHKSITSKRKLKNKP